MFFRMFRMFLYIWLLASSFPVSVYYAMVYLSLGFSIQTVFFVCLGIYSLAIICISAYMSNAATVHASAEVAYAFMETKNGKIQN